MTAPTALRQSMLLRMSSTGFLVFWCVLAFFPIFWIAVMSFKVPVDAFSSNPLSVIFGPRTSDSGRGFSVFDILLVILIGWGVIRFARVKMPGIAVAISPAGHVWVGWVCLIAATILFLLILFFGLLPGLTGFVNELLGPLGRPVIGFTLQHYEAVWIENEFYRNFLNSLIVTGGVVVVSLTVGTLAGYGLARSGTKLAFWILIVALVFRALPHSVLVAGYLPPFINSAEILEPILGEVAPTLYGKPWAVIAVLVSINQPFTIWMLRSFFQNIPTELDEAARVDGCTHFQAFRWVIMPVMWPGVVTTGFFSFLLAYNDYLVTSLLLDAQNQTMVPAIAGYFNRETTTTDQVEAVAAAVSITAPLFLLVMVFQRQIVSGLTAGAVKG